MDDNNLHQTSVLLQLLLQPGELAVAPPHAGRLGREGLTVGLGVEEEQSDPPKHSQYQSAAGSSPKQVLLLDTHFSRNHLTRCCEVQTWKSTTSTQSHVRFVPVTCDTVTDICGPKLSDGT